MKNYSVDLREAAVEEAEVNPLIAHLLRAKNPINKQHQIFEKIWREIYMANLAIANGTDIFRDLKEYLEHSSKANSDEYLKLERLIKLLEGPIHIFAYLPAKYTGILPDGTRIADFGKFKLTNDYYFGITLGGRFSLVDLARRSIADLSSALQLLETPLLAEQKAECEPYIRTLSERIINSGIIADFEDLDRKRYLGLTC